MKKAKRKVAHFSIYTAIIYAIIIFLCILTLYPFVFTIAGSFNNGIDYGLGGVWLFPRKITLANYQVILSDPLLYKVIVRTVIVTIISVFTHVVFTSCVAYAMSRKDLKGRNFFWNYALVTMFFGGGMIPAYVLMRLLGLYDTYFVYVIPGMFSVYNMIIISNFFSSIDAGMRESAYIDGASEFRIWWSIYMPLSTPVLATVALWVAVGKWNAFMPTLLYTDTTKKDLWLLQFYMVKIIKNGEFPDIDKSILDLVSGITIQYAAIIVSSLPIILLYPFLSRFLAKGIMVGSLKG